MPPARRPEFEPAYGARTTDPLLAPPSGPEMSDPETTEGTDVAKAQAPDVTVASDPTAPVEGVAPPAHVPDQGSAERPPLDQAPTGPVATGPVLPARPPVEPAPVAAETPPPTELFDPTSADSDPVPTSRVGNRRFRVRQRILAACAIAVVLAVGYYLVSLAQVWTTGKADDDGPVDAIVVMGAAQYDGRPSPQLAARLDHVVELWPQGIAPLVVVTGGNIPGDRFTEAEASAAYLVERGVPEEALLLENDGSTSYESLEGVADLLDARGLDEVLIVTDPYHALRSRLIAEEVGLDASASSTDSSVVTGGESLRRHLQEAGGVAVGRIIGFDRLTSLVD